MNNGGQDKWRDYFFFFWQDEQDETLKETKMAEFDKQKVWKLTLCTEHKTRCKWLRYFF